MRVIPGQGSPKPPRPPLELRCAPGQESCFSSRVPSRTPHCGVSGFRVVGVDGRNGSRLILLLSFKQCLLRTGQEVADRWYSEIKNYNFQQPGFTSGTGE